MSRKTTLLTTPFGPQPDSNSGKIRMLRRKLPKASKWAVIGFAVLLAIAIILFIARQRVNGLTLIVYNATPGTEVYVDGVLRGAAAIDQETGGPAIRVTGLRAGKHTVRLSNADPEHPIEGADGAVVRIGAPARNKPPGTINYGGSEMILIEGGQFLLGDDSSPNASPSQQVIIDSFYLDKFEISNEQYRKFCAQSSDHPCPKFSNDPANRDLPVIMIGEDDARAYAKWAGKRLPNEKEWEKAASWDPVRQEKRKWPWGNNERQGDVNVGKSPEGLSLLPVGSSGGDVSAYGVYDLAGNALEWVDDFYEPYPGNQTGDRLFNMFNRGFRVVRGGEWRVSFNDARATMRRPEPRSNPALQSKQSWAITFRCAVSTSDPELQKFLRARGLMQ
jgi:iron(II)-dependent oxidoreductase